MFFAALLITLSIECALRETMPAGAPPDARAAHSATDTEMARWLTLLEQPPLPDEPALLRIEITEALTRLPRAEPTWSDLGERYPMRTYICDASGPVRQVIATPVVVVIPARPDDR